MANGDYSPEIEFARTERLKLEKERAGMKSDLHRLRRDLARYDGQAQSSERVFLALERVYEKGNQVYAEMESEFYAVRKFLSTGRLVNNGLGLAIADIEIAVGQIEKLAGSENHLGNVIVTVADKIDRQMKDVVINTREKSYVAGLKQGFNNDEVAMDTKTEDRLQRYATIPYT